MDPYTTHLLLVNHLGAILGDVKEHASSVLAALVLVAVGVPLGELTRRLLAWLLPRMGWEGLSRSCGLTRVIHKVRPDLSAAHVAAQAGGWMIILLILMKALEITNLRSLAWLGRGFFDLLPAAGQTLLILAAAVVIAPLAGRAVLLGSTAPAARLAAGMAQAVVWILGLHAGLLVWGLDRLLVSGLALILLAGWVLALILAWTRHPEQIRETIRVREDRVL